MLHFLQRPLWPLTYNEFFRLDVETPPRHRHGIGVMHRRRARLEDERPQLGEGPCQDNRMAGERGRE